MKNNDFSDTGVKPPSGTWSSEAIHTIGTLVMNKVFTAVVVSESEGTLALDLIDESSTPPVAVLQHLIAAGLCEADKFSSDSVPTVQKEEVSPREPSQLGWTQLPLGQEREVIVCMLQSPGDFFCHIYNLTGKGPFLFLRSTYLLPPSLHFNLSTLHSTYSHLTSHALLLS